MKVLVAYESKYGATAGIAERIAETLRKDGLDVDLLKARDVHEVRSYDAFVIGSAVYYGAWMKEAIDFVEREAPTLATRPLWLFSSGPTGPETTDKQGRDIREVFVPKTIAELPVKPRGQRVFYGAFDPKNIGGILGRLMSKLPTTAGTATGDFRDWTDIASWAQKIAQELVSTPVARVSAAVAG
jgi:menaquinone-dependent protoporphyrinogen oxidase